MKKIYFTSLLFFLFCSAGFCQDDYHYVWYSADSNHLPQNSVKSITPDKYGFLWLSTENGIVRYDGHNFKIFNSETIKGLSSNRMLLFTGNVKKDSIIILNERSETLLIHKRTVKSIDTTAHRKKLHKLLSRDIYYRNRNYYYPKKGVPIAFSVKDKTYLFSMDSISIYNSNYKLSVQKKYTNKDSLQFFVSSGNLYILNKQNEYALFSEINQSYQKFGQAFTKKIKIYSNDIAQQTFLYSDDKLFFIKEKNGEITTQLVFSNFNFETNNIVSAYYDEKSETLFLGSSNKGLLVARQNDFKHNSTSYHHSSGSDDVYYGLAEFGKDNILASTGEIFSTTGETGIISIGDYTDKFMLIVDNNGDVWSKKSATLYHFTKKSHFKEFDKWKMDHVISCLSKGRDGNIYFGLENPNPEKGDLYRINPNVPNPIPEFLLKLKFTALVLHDVDGNTFWCGTLKGLFKINLSTKEIREFEGIKNTTVRNIYAPDTKEAWICSYNNGFFLFRNGKLTHMPKDRNGYLITAHCIIEDKSGYMWITTNKGLFVAKKKDLYDYADKKTNKVYYQFYDKNSGFLNNEFNGGCNSCGINLNNKAIFFPSMDGVVYFNPDNVKKIQPDNDIFLDQTEVDTLTYTNNDSLVFDRNFGKIKFYLSSAFFGNAYNQNIETRLEGPIVQDWTAMTENNVSFSTLPPGEYKLKIRKLSGFGSRYIYKEYNFRVTPAFWETRWFNVFLLLLGLFSVYAFYKLRVRYIKHKNIQLEKQVELKTQQLQNTVVALRKTKNDLSIQVTNHKSLIKTITHDIKSPLRFIAITGRFIYNNIDKAKAISKEDIKAIYSSSSQLYHFVDNFLEYAKETDLNNNESEPYLLHALAEEKALFFKNIATAAKTTLINNVDAQLTITLNHHLLSIILHNLLDNALKNTMNGRIIISSHNTPEALSISIADTGAGMAPEKAAYYIALSEGKNVASKKKGMGLHMIIELLAIISGTLNIISEEGKGTEVIITFKRSD